MTLLEREKNLGSFNSYLKIVTKESGDLGRGEFYLIEEKDHLNICKPNDKNDFMYKKICNLINELIRNENLNCDKCKLVNCSSDGKNLRENFFELFKSNDLFM